MSPFRFEVTVVAKNDELTRDTSRDELAELLQREINDSLAVLPWVIDFHIAEWSRG